MSDLVERLVPDELWSAFQQVVPPVVVQRPQGGGRRRAADREVLAAIIFVAVADCPWRQLPPVFGPCWQTVYRRFAQWSRAGVWADVHRAVSETAGGRVSETEWSKRAVDAVSIRARGER